MGGGSFYEYIKGSSNEKTLTNIITADVDIPETHNYELTFKVKMWASYNAYKSKYRANSGYRLQVRYEDEIVADTQDHSCADSPLFRDYSSGAASYADMLAVSKWVTIGTITKTLNAGRHPFQLWASMWENNNKHAALLVEPFQVELKYI